MATTFKYSGFDVEVEDKELAAKLEDVLADKVYSASALQAAAPGLIAAVARELQTCTDARVEPTKFVVQGGVVKAKVSPDTRGVRGGTKVGQR